MRARSSLSEYQREQLVELFQQGMGYTAAANALGVSKYAARMLCRRFKLHGRLCLVEKPTKQQYSFEIKKEVVQRHLAGETAMDLAREFGLSSQQLVRGWSWKWRKDGDDALKTEAEGQAQRIGHAEAAVGGRQAASRKRTVAGRKCLSKKNCGT